MTTDVDALEDERIFAAGANLLKERNMFDLGTPSTLADFQANPREHLNRLEQTGQPEVLTVEGGPDVVVQTATAYRELLRRLDYAESVLEVQRGLDDIERGDTVELDEAFERIRNGTWRSVP